MVTAGHALIALRALHRRHRAGERTTRVHRTDAPSCCVADALDAPLLERPKRTEIDHLYQLALGRPAAAPAAPEAQ
jgi:hypothetical protein